MVELYEARKIFIDDELISRRLLLKYYRLVVKILGTNDIPENTIIFSQLKQCITELKPNEKKHLKMRFGLNGTKELTLQSIGDKFGVTKESIRKSLDRAFVKLRRSRASFDINHRIELLTKKMQEIQAELMLYTDVIMDAKRTTLTIEDFAFTTRTYNVLKREGYTTYEKLKSITPMQLLSMKNIGIKCADEIWKKLYEVPFPIRSHSDIYTK